MRFDLDKPPTPGTGLAFLRSAEWWAGLFECLRRGSRLVADPTTGLQVLQGTDNNTIALAGMRRVCWGVASAAIGPPTGAGSAQMTSGVVRLWFVDAAGLRSDSGIDVVAYNGWPGETIPSGAWCKLELLEVWEVRAWEC